MRLTALSKTVECMIRLPFEMLQSGRIIPAGMDVFVELVQNSDSFCLNTKTQGGYKLLITDCSLLYTRFTLPIGISESIESTLRVSLHPSS